MTPILANVLLTTARSSYSAGTGRTSQANIYLSGVAAALDELEIQSAQQFLLDAHGGVLHADYQAAVDSGTDIAAFDLVTSIVLRSDGVTPWPADQRANSIATTGSAIAAPGTQVCTPGSMTNITVGTPLLCDSGASQEVVLVASVTGTTFTATFGKTHAGGFALALLNTLYRVVFVRETAPLILPERNIFLQRIYGGGPISQ